VFESDFVMFTEGRTPEETGLVWVENQQYFGYGFLDNDLAGLSFAQMKACIEPRLSTPEANAIIQQFLKSGKYLKYLSFDSHNLDD
jgi:DNA polymerase-3 subunit epsilon